MQAPSLMQVTDPLEIPLRLSWLNRRTVPVSISDYVLMQDSNAATSLLSSVSANSVVFAKAVQNSLRVDM